MRATHSVCVCVGVGIGVEGVVRAGVEVVVGVVVWVAVVSGWLDKTLPPRAPRETHTEDSQDSQESYGQEPDGQEPHG
jgi:hypothetical protein